MSTSDKSQAKDFLLGNMADDLLSLTLDLCRRKDSSTPRFPRLLYDSYVNQIIQAAILIQKKYYYCKRVVSFCPAQRASTRSRIYMHMAYSYDPYCRATWMG